MKVLVVGSGGREHSLCWAIAKSPKCKRLYAAPGNPGMAQMAECVAISVDKHDALVQFAMDEGIEFVVVGPEAPLVEGLVDKLEAAGIKAFGPNSRAGSIPALGTNPLSTSYGDSWSAFFSRMPQE